jgi:ribonuclease Z
MKKSRISRVVVTLASLLFAGLALECWVVPDEAARRLGLQAVSESGIAALRADVGGLFMGLAILCGAAAATLRRGWMFAAASVLAAVAAGRAFGWIGGGAFGADLTEFAIEAAVGAALLGLARGAARVSTPASSPVPTRRFRPAAIALAALAIMGVAGGVAVMASPSLQQRIFDRAAEKMAATINSAPLHDDALRVAVCGSSAPLPSASRAKACVAVFAGGRFYVVDAGPESVENLVLWGVPLSAIGGALLTHFHSDHIGDLGELNLQTWAGGRTAPLTVYGGPGVEKVVEGFNDAYRLDQGYRTAHHTEQVMPSATWPMVPHVVELDGAATEAKDRMAVVLDDGGLKITAIEVNHAPIAPAYAYRFDYKGRSALITGDLKYHPPLVAGARDVDLLVSEAIAVQMTRSLGKGASDAGRSGTAAIMHDIEDYHITPEQAAQIANEANARMLVFYHLLPAPDGLLPRRLFAQGVDRVRRGGWTIADDGSLYTLPIGSGEIKIGRVVE